MKTDISNPQNQASTLAMTAQLRQRWISPNASAPLGTITKLQVVPENKGLQENIPSDAVKLVELFALQELACESLTKKEERTNKKGIKYDTYVHRVNYCLRQRIDALKLVSVRYNQKERKPTTTTYSVVAVYGLVHFVLVRFPKEEGRS